MCMTTMLSGLLLMLSMSAHAITASYNYDDIGRLTRVDYPNNESIAYVYDAAGNILSSTTTIADADLDGIADATDNCPSIFNSNQLNNDNDNAGDACDPDDDNDTITDVYELANGLDPLNAGDASSDYDMDGLTALQEFAAGTRADLADSDFDGDTDAEELAFGTDPTNPLDNINAHRPYAPVLMAFNSAQDVSGLVLQADLFSDPDALSGDVISADQWQLAKDLAFNDIIIDRTRIGSELPNDGVSFNVPNGLLQTANSYYFRARHRDATMLWSDWSLVESLNTTATNALDSDEDGVADQYQIAGPTDVNNNGLDDAQEGIKVVMDAINGEMIGVESQGGIVTSLSAVPVAELPATLLTDNIMPYGLFRFTVDITAAGINPLTPVTTEVTLYFPTVLPAGTTWLKLDTVTNQLIDYTDHVSFFENTATLLLTDGGLVDLDKVVNGYILDPGGPVLPLADSDLDGIADHLDNCINISNVSQLDTDADGYGNFCDADLNNDGIVNAIDLGLFKQAFFSFGDVVSDLNGDGVVNSLDLGLFGQLFFLPPGPSGLVP